MQNDDRIHTLALSRRGLLRGAGFAAGGGVLLAAGLTATQAQAQTKVTQQLAHYQDTPKGNARCDNCAQWQAPASCKIVQGKISPSGWCILYAPKS
jgi:hypothetical protein